MKYMFLAVMFMSVSVSYALDHGRTTSVSDFTGDNIEMSKGVVGATVSVVAPFSSGRAALTVINVSTNTIYLGASSAVTANGAASFALPAGQSIQFRSSGAIYGVVDPTVSSMTVHSIKEY